MKVEDLYRLNKDRFDHYLVKHNKKHTIERETILQRACELPPPFTAEQLVNAVEKDHISQATVYNVLTLLRDAQIIHLSGNGDQQQRMYEVIGTNNNHLQIICTKCGRVTDFKDVAITNVLHNKRFNNFNLQHFSLFAYGECKVCRKKKRKE